MNLNQIKEAVLAGKIICWKNSGYKIINCCDNWTIVWNYGGKDENSIGLTWRDEKTLNGEESDFYINRG